MMSKTYEIPYGKRTLADLTDQEKELVKCSEQSLSQAHAPYSKFTVGSAVLLKGGKIFSGSNQENAAYPSGLCAERVALFKAKSECANAIETIVVIARNERGEAADAFACGGCRQAMMEYACLQETPIKILMRNKEEWFIEVRDVRWLLPFSFEAKTLT